jgi:hypothetical protein
LIFYCLDQNKTLSPEELQQKRLQRQSAAQKRLAKEREQEEIRQLLKEEKLEQLTPDDLVRYRLILISNEVSFFSVQSDES